jgi:deazaflavin-dependent oxidoreductase (nitroreductase family)
LVLTGEAARSDAQQTWLILNTFLISQEGGTALNDPVREALAMGGVIDITTKGRKSGDPRRIEIVFHPIDGRYYISGFPREKKRSWLANLEANPRFTFHLKGDVQADLQATARPITAEAERRAVLPNIARTWNRDDLDYMVQHSPLVEVTFDGP